MLSVAVVESAHAAPPSVSPEVKEGIIAYNKGDFKSAVGSFSGALNSEFNNPVVHYYLGNCFVHLNQPESAIREFRIAYAISPDNEVGKFSKDALKIFGVETDEPGTAKDGRTESGRPKGDAMPDPALEQAIKSLRKQTFFARTSETKSNELNAKDAERRASEHLDRTRQEIKNANTYVGRRGRVHQPPMSQDSQKMLDDLKAQFDSQLNARKKTNDDKVDELQRSADNLESLLMEQKKGKAPKLKPAGTNLYIRNYESAKPKTATDAEVQTKPRDDNPFSMP
jgi:tetratricopeptide (TPR) repeat protein